jgi:hypothetical protein
VLLKIQVSWKAKLGRRASSFRNGKVVPVHNMKACRGSKGIPPLILDLGAKWRWVVNIMPRPLYPRKQHRYPLNCSYRANRSTMFSDLGNEETVIT